MMAAIITRIAERIYSGLLPMILLVLISIFLFLVSYAGIIIAINLGVLAYWGLLPLTLFLFLAWCLG